MINYLSKTKVIALYSVVKNNKTQYVAIFSSIVYYIKICSYKICKYNFNLFIILCLELAACTVFCRGTNTLILYSCELNFNKRKSFGSTHLRKNLRKSC